MDSQVEASIVRSRCSSIPGSFSPIYVFPRARRTCFRTFHTRVFIVLLFTVVPKMLQKAFKLYLKVKDRTYETHSKASASRRCKHQIASLIRGGREPSTPVTCQTGRNEIIVIKIQMAFASGS